MKNSKGLSLIEILVVLVITGLIAACVSAAVIGGYYMLKQAEHKSRAMSITHVKLQEYLAKSFDSLGPNQTISGDEGNISQAFVQSQDNTFFNWTVRIVNDTIGVINKVPYKNVTVETEYTEVNPQGKEVSSRTIRLSNLVPYPLIHIQSTRDTFGITEFDRYRAPRTDVPYERITTPGQYNWGSILGATLNILDFNYAVPKDLIIMYNLAICYDTDHSPGPTQTVLTRCKIDGGQTEGIITRTPIRSQVFINNILQVENVPAGKHSIQIDWCQEADPGNTRQAAGADPWDSGVKVWLRAYDITVVAVEHKDKT
ncbi:MAG: prepilin-type N-terminal cleavage/methylation domain-containing protein [Candidatus Omnitrophica bacterium]|nr:prepilin-type N-terminal cleavage/methylation domain-containing protein [Candidatus Omnitrophota bacterium]